MTKLIYLRPQNSKGLSKDFSIFILKVLIINMVIADAIAHCYIFSTFNSYYDVEFLTNIKLQVNYIFITLTHFYQINTRFEQSNSKILNY